MNLSAPFIHRPVMTSLVMLTIFVAGVIAYLKLPISSMPNVNYPTVNVKAVFPGALPETMADSVALPLEKQFMAIPGLRLVSSNSTLGNTSIILQFDIDKDIITAAQDVQEAITAAIPYLPPDMPYGPIYRKVNPADLPIMYITLTSKTLPRTDLYTYGNTLIGQRISMIAGISQVTTYGSILAVRIQVDPSRLVAQNVTLDDVVNQVVLENALIATGQLDGTIEAPIISVDGQLEHAAQYENMVIVYRNGTPVRIKDVGRAVDSFQNTKLIPRYIDADGVQESVVLAIQKDPGANTVAIADSIYQLLGTLKTELPPAVDIHIINDRSVPVRAAINDATLTLGFALLLVVLVIYLFLGKTRDTIIPALVLPMSVIGTFAVMSMLNFTLDNLSILALTLAVGFIIDDAVVVMENIIREVESGSPPLKAALDGSRQICFTIVSMSLSLIAVFIPMLFMGGLIGKLFREFAITLSVITILSGFISLTLTPMLSSRFIPPKNSKATSTKMSRFADKMHHITQQRYKKMLVAVLDHHKSALAVGLACLIATAWLIVHIPTDFLPDEDIGFFVVYTQALEGGSSYNMVDLESQLIELLRKNPAIQAFVSISAYSEYRKGLNLVRLKPQGERPPIQDVIQGVYKDLLQINGMQAFIKNVPLIDIAVGQENRAAYQFALQSIFIDKLDPAARELLTKMRSDQIFQGVNTDLEVDTPQININIQRDRASTYGITAADIENAFAFSYSGNLISRIQTPIDQYDVILELYPEYQRQADTLNKIWLRSSITQELVPLSATLHWEEGLGASSVNHINQFPSATISFNLAPGVPLETALDKLDKLTAQFAHQGVTAKTIGAAQTFTESITSSGYLLILTVFSIYIILGILYESFLHPITILTTLPPATLGGLLVLLVLGLPLSLYSFIGIVMLLGIVKKNGIMIVDFAIENMRLKGMNAREAILDSCMVRYRPIMMTTAAAIFGVLPIAMGIGSNAEARRPLGLVIVGGLLLSQLITLFITPILYLAIENLKTKTSSTKPV